MFEVVRISDPCYDKRTGHLHGCEHLFSHRTGGVEVGTAACGRDCGQVGALQVPQRVLQRRGVPTKASEVARSALVAKTDDERETERPRKMIKQPDASPTFLSGAWVLLFQMRFNSSFLWADEFGH